MKHLVTVTRGLPAKALLEGHPGVVESITGLLKDPLGTLGTHLSKGADAP